MPVTGVRKYGVRHGGPYRMPHRAAVAFALIGLCPAPHAQADASVVRCSFTGDSRWSFDADGAFDGWTDRRDLFVLHHPWTASQAGKAATISRDVRVPQDWNGRIRLHFYMSDDYDGTSKRLEAGNWLGQCNFIGHRYKQVLVDDTIVWERDVSDAEGARVPTRFAVVLPESIGGGDAFRLTFRLIDKTSTADRGPADHRHIGSTDQIKEGDPWHFMTNVYVGDVVLASGTDEAEGPGTSPSAAAVHARRENSRPLPLPGPGIDFPVPLALEGQEGLQGTSCAVRAGLPLPQGAVRDPHQIDLRHRNGDRQPAQLTAMNRWPDGSIRWVLIDTVVTANGQTQPLSLDVSAPSPSPAPARPVAVSDSDGELTITTAGLRIACGPGGKPLRCRLANGDCVLDDLVGRMQIDGQACLPIVESARILAAGPIRGEVELTGMLRAGAEPIGRFVFRLAAFAGQPYARITWRVFNEQPKPLRITRFELVGRFETGEQAASHWGPDEKSGGVPIGVRQTRADRFEVTGPGNDVLDQGEAAAGWLGIRSENRSVAVVVRHFREQFPKALRYENDLLHVRLFEPSSDEPAYMPTEGEAKRHEIWIGLWDEALPVERMRQFAGYAARPPRLFNAEYVCATGGLGRAAVHDAERFSALDAFMKKTFPAVAAHRFYVNGIRNWGDQIYNQDEDYWFNGYYDRQQGFAAEYLMTGDPRWFDRLEATVRHIIDIDVCHASVAHPDWVGSIHAYNGANHTGAGPWNAMQRIKGTLAYWRLTGDTDARDAALGVADSAIRANRGIGAGSVRDHAGILYCLTAAYDETLDTKYLQAARRVAHDAIGRIDRRRGCYSEIHGNVSYRGNVPWMCAQLAEPMYDYYRQSGDIDAAIATVGLAESILTENCERGVLGDVYGYSHNPHFKKTSNYHILIAPAVLYAYELTADRFFLEHGRAMYAQTLRENTVNSIVNCYWNTPTLLYYLQAFGLNEDPKQ